jgi:hypothetical protein
VLLEIGAFANLVTTAPRKSARGLELADQTIESVIKVIEEEQAKLDPAEFENRGHISSVSYGGGERAPALALHYTRAHAVTTDTLRGVREDLRTFQQACRDARKLIAGTDEDAADRLQVTQVAVDGLVVGSWSDRGEQSNEQAQEDHDYDTIPDHEDTGDE